MKNSLKFQEVKHKNKKLFFIWCDCLLSILLCEHHQKNSCLTFNSIVHNSLMVCNCMQLQTIAHICVHLHAIQIFLVERVPKFLQKTALVNKCTHLFAHVCICLLLCTIIFLHMFVGQLICKDWPLQQHVYISAKLNILLFICESARTKETKKHDDCFTIFE